MATIKGVWKFNEVVELINIVQDVNYSCGSKTDQTRVSVINGSDGQRIMIQPAFSNVYYAVSGWANATNRIWDFGETDQEVSDDFAAWVFQNANGGKVSFPATDGNISVLVKENGTTTLATAGTYCESDIDVNVDVPTGGDTAIIQPLTITENGTYYASNNVQGYAPITVDVSGQSMADSIINRTITEIESNVTKIGYAAFQYCNSLNTAIFPKATIIENSAFSACTSLKEVDFPLVTSLGSSAFQQCTSLEEANFPLITSVGNYTFRACDYLIKLNFPLVTSIGSYAFASCDNLQTAEFPLVTSIDSYAFEASGLSTLILRSETACTLAATNALINTPIARGTGYIYVPSALIEEYKVADNWSKYAAQFRALEDYTVDGTTTGELDPDKI